MTEYVSILLTDADDVELAEKCALKICAIYLGGIWTTIDHVTIIPIT